MEKNLIHLEGLIIFLASFFLYWYFNYSILMFILLLLTPDISILAYKINSFVGSRCYNLFHTYIFPIILTVLGVILGLPFIISIGLIWIAHIGMDRMLGFGLRYNNGFKDTHLQRL